ncbi:MAG: polyphosphate kinase 2 [Sulfurimonas sp. RIFCSPHIGHO2_12_FULL_36_9]|uniref:polyphosphate kinase 2 n=1 Tax=Sulfurimonas sp. RIFCSPLOWO2_12_36_12 TaxID=1802253 RepID=UPI0008AECEB3|nr:polyphosphate kinase 2 [Sulfurimonas sp. RIFCSPLOWO2_12_36_12]OHD98383.1 MAG: polyphosphate kinase 2 [Sulfurimonas sp. RIFCSPHIGHO2_12_FULL_36_9]OHE01801.1 MAG: polyphosphate kinase 2 [Sulfurimonas sp. RIFCSPLOWO2_12_36_12]
MEEKRAENRDRRKENRDGKIQVWVKEESVIYEKELEKLQVELLKYQNYVKEKGLKVIMIFEGRDAAGKGGTIKRITEHLNPRGARIVALAKPNEQEITQWYFQRYTQHLPSAGEIVLFDRSWYNRAMVEPVMGFCSDEEYQKFLNDAPVFEKMIIDKDTKIFKFYFSISKEEQSKRLQNRENDPLKQYKLSPIDQLAQKLWDEYTLAKYKMLKATNTKYAPWTIIKSDNKKKARINIIKHILNFVDYPNKISSDEIVVDKNIIINAQDEIQAMKKNIL